MAKRNSDTAAETFHRLVIMIGVLVIGSMALYEYGPPPEDAAAMIHRLLDATGGKAVAAEPGLLSPPNEDALAANAGLSAMSRPVSGPESSTENAPTEVAPAWPEHDPLRDPTSGENAGNNEFGRPISDTVSLDTTAANPALAALTEEIQRLGATGCEVRPWGRAGRLHRFQCTMPVSPGSALKRHFDAIEQTPILAAAQVLSELQQWRNEQARSITQ